jgi:hypothetical protein
VAAPHGGDARGSSAKWGRAALGWGVLTRRARLVLLGIVGVLLASAALYPDFTRVHGDGYYTYLWTRSLVFDGDLDFHEDYRICPDPWGMAHMPHGDDMNQWNPGPSIFWAPFLIWDRVTGHPSLSVGGDHERNGCLGVVTDRAVRGSFVAGILTVLCAFFATRRHFGEGSTLIGVIIACLLSPLAFYAALLWSYGHAASAATSGIVVWLWIRERSRPTRWGWIWMGIAMGAAMLTRPQNAILVVLPLSHWLAVGRARLELGDRRALLRHVGWGFAYVATIVIVFAPQLWFWWDTTGELFLIPQSEHYMRWGAPRIWQTLWSTEAGLFPWSPVLYLSFAGIVLLAVKKETRAIGLPLLLVLALHTYVAAAVFDWWGGTSYPGRRFDSMVVPFAIGAAALVNEVYTRSRARPGMMGGLLALGLLGTGLLWTAGVESLAVVGAVSHAPERADRLWARTLERTSGPLWEAVGNPLAWPASIPFAIRFGLHPRAWDVAGAPELFFHHWLTMERAGGDWRFDVLEHHAALVAGFDEEPTSIEGRRVRMMSGEHAHGVIPMSWPTLGAIEIELAVPESDADGVALWVGLGDEDLGSHHVGPGASDLRIETSGIVEHDGFQALRLRVLAGRVGLRAIDLLDPEPSPAELQRDVNARALARRRAWVEARRPASPPPP